MPAKKSGAKLVRVPVGVPPGQLAILKRLVETGLYGTTEGDIVRYFITKGIEHLAETRILKLDAEQ